MQRLMISAKGEQITLLDVMRELHAEVFENTSPEAAANAEEEGRTLNLEKMVEKLRKTSSSTPVKSTALLEKWRKPLESARHS